MLKQKVNYVSTFQLIAMIPLPFFKLKRLTKHFASDYTRIFRIEHIRTLRTEEYPKVLTLKVFEIRKNKIM